MDRYSDTLKHKLADLSRLGAVTDATDKAIVSAARERLERVNKDIEKLRPRALTDEAVAEHYQALILERGKLHQVMGKANA